MTQLIIITHFNPHQTSPGDVKLDGGCQTSVSSQIIIYNVLNKNRCDGEDKFTSGVSISET